MEIVFWTWHVGEQTKP